LNKINFRKFPENPKENCQIEKEAKEKLGKIFSFTHAFFPKPTK
jgi:hypothetical protein